MTTAALQLLEGDESLGNEPEPTWEIARLFPFQGEWTELEYLDLPDARGVELSDGSIEVLPMPTESHQWIAEFLYDLLKVFVKQGRLGVVYLAGLRLRLWPGKMREPDVVFMSAEHSHRRHEECWEGADLVMEVVSGGPKDRERDLVTKRAEYARAGIAEYWIVDPEEQRITVLALVGDTYRVHGEHGPGSEATSVLLPGFTASVDAVLAAPDA